MMICPLLYSVGVTGCANVVALEVYEMWGLNLTKADLADTNPEQILIRSSVFPSTDARYVHMLTRSPDGLIYKRADG